MMCPHFFDDPRDCNKCELDRLRAELEQAHENADLYRNALGLSENSSKTILAAIEALKKERGEATSTLAVILACDRAKALLECAELLRQAKEAQPLSPTTRHEWWKVWEARTDKALAALDGKGNDLRIIKKESDLTRFEDMKPINITDGMESSAYVRGMRDD